MNERENRSVINTHNLSLADTSPVGTFVFSILCYAFWAADIGLLGEGSTLAIGLLQFAVFITYMITGVTLAQKGVGVGANTYLLFGTCFGAIGGSFNVFGSLFAIWNIPFNYSVVGIAFVLAGAYLILVLPALRYASKIDFMVFFWGGVGILGTGLTILGFLPAWFNFINGWALFLDGTFGFYSVIATVLAFSGVTIPMGKPFFQPR